MTLNQLVFAIAGFLTTGSVALLCYTLREILTEMRRLNNQLIEVVRNQEWHYGAIQNLQENEKQTDERLRCLERRSPEVNL